MRITIEENHQGQPVITHVSGGEAAGADKSATPASPVHADASTNGPQAPQLVAVQRKHGPWGIIFALLLIIAVVVAGVSLFNSGADRQTTNDAYIEGRVIRLSPKVAGQVIALHVDDNVPVKAGDVMLEIDPVDYQAKVDQAAAAVAAGQSAVEEANASVLRAQATVGEAQAAFRVAGTEAGRRASDYRRYKAMGTDGVSEQELETAKDAADAADDQRDAAAKKQDAAAAELNVVRTNVGAAQAQLEAAKAQLHFAQLQLQYTKVMAPESGKVTNKHVEQGDFVGTGQPLLAIVTDDIWVIANFKEVQLEKMHMGELVEVRVDACPDLTFRAHVQSLQAGTGSRFQLLPPENATGNWVKVVQRLPVKIVFEPGQAGLDRLAQGMSAEVTVVTRSEEGR